VGQARACRSAVGLRLRVGAPGHRADARARRRLAKHRSAFSAPGAAVPKRGFRRRWPSPGRALEARLQRAPRRARARAAQRRARAAQQCAGHAFTRGTGARSAASRAQRGPRPAAFALGLHRFAWQRRPVRRFRPTAAGPASEPRALDATRGRYGAAAHAHVDESARCRPPSGSATSKQRRASCGRAASLAARHRPACPGGPCPGGACTDGTSAGPLGRAACGGTRPREPPGSAQLASPLGARVASLRSRIRRTRLDTSAGSGAAHRASTPSARPAT
jgi:hypothetical protein